jgi:hypothetical protein
MTSYRVSKDPPKPKRSPEPGMKVESYRFRSGFSYERAEALDWRMNMVYIVKKAEGAFRMPAFVAEGLDSMARPVPFAGTHCGRAGRRLRPSVAGRFS